MKAVLISLLLAFNANAFMVPIGPHCQVNVGVVLPPARAAVVADVLYFHGFGDRWENHLPLFKSWSKRGLRTIAFDLPSHGRTECGSINRATFSSLARLASDIEAQVRMEQDRPLFLAGWSTGGLIAVRVIQMGFFAERLTGLVLFAPAVAPRWVVGEKGFVTEETLTNNPNPPHVSQPRPVSPFLKPLFSVDLMANAYASHASLSPSIPISIFVAGDEEDLYVHSPAVKMWALNQRAGGVNVSGYQCQGAKHELDNNLNGVGPAVQELSGQFMSYVIHHSMIPAPEDAAKICPPF